MIFRVTRLVKDLNALETILRDNKKITYLNLWSLKAYDHFDHKLYFIIDGLSIYLYAKFFGIKADLISFNLNNDFWVNKLKSYKRVILVGHNIDELMTLEQKMIHTGNFNAKAICDGFKSDDEIINAIYDHMIDGDIAILALGQPRSEILMSKLGDDLPGPVVSVGGFLKQKYLQDNVIPSFVQKLGIAAFYRHYKNPKILFERTLGSLGSLRNFYLREDE